MSLAEIKRRLVVGSKVELVHHSWYPNLKPTMLGVRSIKTAQTNAVQFSNGSWLWWPKADHVRDTDNGFEVSLYEGSGPVTWGEVMRYEWR